MSTEETSGGAAGLGSVPAAAWFAWLPSWPWLLALVAMLRALTSAPALLHDPDTYLHIAVGRWIFAHRALPVADPFSYTLPGARWIPGEWLGEVALAAAYGAGGWGAVVVATAAAFAAAVGLFAYFLLRRLEPIPVVIATLAAATLVLPHLLARPHVLALPLLVVWCGALLAARDDAGPPPEALLPVMALWANLHGSFMFGLALAGYLAAEAVLRSPPPARLAAARRWGGFVAAAAACALLTPNGPETLLQPLRLVGMPALQAGFVEWRPADLERFPALELWMLGAVALAFACRARQPWTRVLLLLGLVHMALAHVRHADLLALVAPLAVAAGFAPGLSELLRPARSSALVCAAAALARPAPGRALAMALALAVAVALPALSHPPTRSGDAVTPDAAVAAAARLGLKGPVFNAEGFGGYLIFSGVPVFIDGRIEMYGNDFLATYLAAERGDPTALAWLLDKYQVSWTLLQTESPAAAALDRLPGWRAAYADTRAVIHVRDAPPGE